MFKEHTTYITQSTIANSLITRKRSLPPKPNMIDNFLDIPSHERERVRLEYQKNGRSYHHHVSQTDQTVNPPPTNRLILPDRLVNSFLPIFIIRHPAKQVGSYYKATRINQTEINAPDTEIGLSYKFDRVLFGYYKALYLHRTDVDGDGVLPHNLKGMDLSNWPIVIDGDDLINDTERISNRFCEMVSIESSGVIYEWEKTTTSDPFEAVFKGTLNASKGVVRNPVRAS